MLAVILALNIPFECIDLFKNEQEGQRVLSGSRFDFKQSLFLLFKFGDFSEISLIVVVLVTIVIPHTGILWILRRLAYTTGKIFPIIYGYCSLTWTVGVPDLLQISKPLK
jgi:hypothetical protein